MFATYFLQPIDSQRHEWSLASSLVIGLLTLLVCYIINFYVDRRNYPPGPFPLPFIGNAHCEYSTLQLVA